VLRADCIGWCQLKKEEGGWREMERMKAVVVQMRPVSESARPCGFGAGVRGVVGVERGSLCDVESTGAEKMSLRASRRVSSVSASSERS